MARIPLVFPFAGRRDDSAHHDQAELTTPQAQNVRARGPDGRLTGARRSGMTKWNPDAIGVGPVRALVSTAIDDRKLEYAYSQGNVETDWSAITPSKGNSLGGAVDSNGNVYALDGSSGIVKYNSRGREIMKIVLPIADKLHVVRAIHVDEAGRIFAGVSSGGDVRTARVWCILQLLDNQWAVLWTLEPGAYTESLQVFRGAQLYAAHNYPQENRGRVVIYEGIGIDPREVRRIETVPYPLHGMFVTPEGQLYCASPDSRGDALDESSVQANYRPGHPSLRNFHPWVEAWTPWQLTNARKRIWSWYDADDIDETDLEQAGDTPTVDDGQQILRWRDRTENNRHWYAGSLIATDEAGPTLAKVGPGGRKAVRFTNVGSTKQSMVTLPNASIQTNLADQQRTAMPAYTDSMWAMFILMRPTRDDDAASSGPRVVFYAPNDISANGNHGLWVNRACGATEPGTYSAGAVSYFAKTDSVDKGACGGADQFAARAFTSFSLGTDLCLVTILWDGGIDPNDTTKTRCLFRVNGEPVDRCEGLAFSSLQANYLAYAPSVATAVARRLNGEVCAMMFLDRSDRTSLTEPKVATHDQLEASSTPAAQTDNEIARIESYFMHGRGLGNALGIANIGDFPHFYGIDADGRSSPPDTSGGGRSVAFEELIQRYPMTTKHDAQGVLKWVCNEETHPDTGSDLGGIGWAVAAKTLDDTTHVYMAGPDAVAGGDVVARKVIDLGSSFTGATADGAWRLAGSGALQYAYPRIAVDDFGNLFIPGYIGLNALYVVAKDGSGGNAVELLDFLLPGASATAHAVALPPTSLTPAYRDDLATPIAEWCALFTAGGDGALDPADSVFRIQLVTSAALTSGSPRTIHTIAVLEDDVRLVTDASNTIPSGGTAVVSSTAQFVQAFRAGDDIIIIDGVSVLAYSLRDGTVAPLVSTSAGEVPARPQLGMYWRHRLVLGRFADRPGNYAASRLGNIRDWNLMPGALPTGEQIQTSTQAFTGSATRAGEAEDAIVAMIPVWDDLAYFLCESRILRLTGDPQDGGNIHKVTDSIGGTFGDSWCKDSSGRVFFFGFGNGTPGLYMLPPDQGPVPLSRHTIEETEFAEIDFSSHRIVLAWNPIEKGVHIFRVAWATSTIVTHWFWEERSHRMVRNPPLWSDKINSADLQPTAVTYLGGDDSRCLLIGCADGYIRKWDPEAEDDDGTPIDAYFAVKVSPRGGPVAEWLMREVQVALADDLEGCRLEVFASDTADTMGPVQAAIDIGPGLNDAFRCRLRGNHLWVRLRSALPGRWAYEGATVDIVPRGKQVSSDG